jgi:hypothetical protein
LALEDNGHDLVRIEKGCDFVGMVLKNKVIAKFFSLCGLSIGHLTTLGSHCEHQQWYDYKR